MTFAFNFIVCVVFGTARVIGHKEAAFQALAHVYVGGLLVYGHGRLWPYDCLGRDYCYHRADRRFWYMAWILSLVELGTAIWQRGTIARAWAALGAII